MPPSPLHATDLRCRITVPSSSPERLLWMWAGVVAVLSHLFEMVKGHYYWAVVFCHVCLGKQCDICETRDRRAKQWQPMISYSQIDTLWSLFWAIRACHEVYIVCGSRLTCPWLNYGKKLQELLLFHEHYIIHKYNKFTPIISIETNDKFSTIIINNRDPSSRNSP